MEEEEKGEVAYAIKDKGGGVGEELWKMGHVHSYEEGGNKAITQYKKGQT